MKKFLKIFSVLLFILLIAGCSSSRKSADENVAVVSGSMEQRFASIVESREDWECVAVPVKFDLKSPGSISFSGKAYFVRGKEVFISLRKIGFEVAQLSLTPDTILLVDKFNGRHVLENISSLVKGAPVDITDLQSLFFGQPFIASAKLSPKKFSFFDRQSEWYAIPKNEDTPFAAAFSFNSGNNVMVSAATRYFTMSYDGVAHFGKMILPVKENIVVNKDKVKVNAVITFNWDNAIWNNPDEIRHIKMPSAKSRRLDTQSLLKSLGVK